MRLVVIESPFAGDVEYNLDYLAHCIWDSLGRGEAPYASHAFYTQYLEDATPAEREHGILAGFAWGQKADLRAVYTDLGMSSGMKRGVEEAARLGQAIEYRTLGRGWAPRAAVRRESIPGPASVRGDFMCTGCGLVIASVEAAVQVPTRIGHCYSHAGCLKQTEAEAAKSRRFVYEGRKR